MAAKPVTTLHDPLSDDDVARQAFLGDVRILDYSADGGVVGIEFVCASEGVDLAGC